MLNQKDGFERDKRSARDGAHSCAGFSARSWASPSADTCGTWQPVIVSWCGTSPVHLMALGISCVLLVTCCSWYLTPAGHVSLCPPLSPSVPWQSLSPAVGAQRLRAVSLGLGMQHPALLGPSFPHWLLKVHFPENGSFQTWGERDLSKRWKRKKKDEKKQADLSAAACASPFHPHVQWAEPGECARVDYLHTTTTQLQGRLFSARSLWRNAQQGKNKDILRFNLHTYSQSTTYSKKRSW